MLWNFSTPIRKGSKPPQNEKPETPTGNDHPVQARESGCMITANTTHYINRDLTLAADYYDKIFTRLSGPPCWLAQRLQLTFVPVPLPNDGEAPGKQQKMNSRMNV